jgi:hypothetical protein
VTGLKKKLGIIILFRLPHASGVVGDTGAELPHPYHSASLHSTLSSLTALARLAGGLAHPVEYTSLSSDRSLPLGTDSQPTSLHTRTRHSTNNLTQLRRPFGTQVKATSSSKVHFALPCALVNTFLAYRTTFRPFKDHNPNQLATMSAQCAHCRASDKELRIMLCGDVCIHAILSSVMYRITDSTSLVSFTWVLFQAGRYKTFDRETYRLTSFITQCQFSDWCFLLLALRVYRLNHFP